MTTARLQRRLDKIAGPEEAAVPVPDTSVLSGAQQDRFNVLFGCYASGQASDSEVTEVLELIRLCPPEGPDGPRKPYILVRPLLERYWRFARRDPSRKALPHGNYYFHQLSFADRERLMELCIRYGWEPESDHVDIAPVDNWSGKDYDELCVLLYAAVSPLERRYWPDTAQPVGDTQTRFSQADRHPK